MRLLNIKLEENSIFSEFNYFYNKSASNVLSAKVKYMFKGDQTNLLIEIMHTKGFYLYYPKNNCPPPNRLQRNSPNSIRQSVKYLQMTIYRLLTMYIQSAIYLQNVTQVLERSESQSP